MAEEETTIAIASTPISHIKSLVPDPSFFDGDRKKFADWWRGMVLYMKFHKIDGADDKATAVLSRMRGGTAGHFATHWTDKMEKDNDTIDWDKFEREVKSTFSYGNKKENAEWKIEQFKQGNQQIADYLVEFDVLKSKSDMDDKHLIFLLKKHVRNDIIKAIMGYPPENFATTYGEWKKAIKSVGMGYESTEIRKENMMNQKTGTGITYGGRGQPMDIGERKFEWNDKGEPKCFKCQSFGHLARNCTKKSDSKEWKKKIKCHGCGRMGHFVKECRNKGVKIRALDEEKEGDKEEEEEQGFSEGSE